jgi:sulfur-oxidizing protein SoxY
MKRRSFLKSTVVASAAISTGILSTNSAFAAAHGGDITKAKSVDEVLKMLGASGATASADIKIKAPEIAENGAVVPVGITSKIAGTTEIVSITAANPTPFAAKYIIGEGTDPAVKSRFKMGKTTDVIVVVKAGGKFYTAKANVKVTKGGCGG